MNRLILLTALTMSGLTAAASGPDRTQILGEWSGRGENVGQPFSACAKFTPYMDNVYLHLDYRTRYDNAGSLPDQTTESFYTFLESTRVEGVTLDSLSNVFQLNGIYSDHRMSVLWLKNGNTIGKSEWRLSADGNTLTFVRFGQMGGEFKEIGEVNMSRLQNGEHCTK
jgi:hypothetical protein